MISFLSFLALAAAAAPAGAPVYLSCSIAGNDSPIDVQLNEANGTATYAITLDGQTRTYTVAAAFAADRVTFNSFSINRVNMSFQRDNSRFVGIISGLKPVDNGQCQKVTVSRQF